MKYLCAYGCGEKKEKEMIQNKEALEEGDKSYYCPSCKRDGWFILPDFQENEELIAEFLEDLKLNSPMCGFKYTRNELIEKWEGKRDVR